MDGYRTVLFDWRGTLAHCPEDAWWVGRALQAIGRLVDPEVVEAAVAGLRAAAELLGGWDVRPRSAAGDHLMAAEPRLPRTRDWISQACRSWLP